MSGRGRKTSQNRVDRANDKVGAKPCTHATKGCSETGHRMSTECVKYHCSQWNQNDIAHLRCKVRKNAGNDNCISHKTFRCTEHELLDQHGKQAGTLGHPDANHNDQHQPEWRKLHEIVLDIGVNPSDTIGTEQAASFDRLACRRMQSRQLQAGTDCRNCCYYYCHQKEESSRMWQSIADSLNRVKNCIKMVLRHRVNKSYLGLILKSSHKDTKFQQNAQTPINRPKTLSIKVIGSHHIVHISGLCSA